MRGRLALLLAAATGLAACIDKPLRPSERPDGAPVDHDASDCVDPADDRTGWDANDLVRFDQVTAQLNGDCFDDLIVPGAIDGSSGGVFVLLGRSADDFFTGGYDHFIATVDSEPLRVAATDLVGGPPLDLVVFARSIADEAVGEAEVLVFEGMGDGTFLGGDLSLRLSDTAIPEVGLDEPGHFTAELMSADAGGPPELVIGDSGSTFVIAPDSWSSAGLPSAAVFEPFSDPGTQGVMVAPSGSAGADDLVQVDTAAWKGFVHPGPLDYGPGTVATMVDSGPRMLLAPDADATTDIASVSVQAERLSFLFFTPPAGVGESGAMVVKRFRDETIGTGDGFIDAALLIGLGGGEAPELLVYDAGAPGVSAVLRLYHDVADSGETVDPAGDGEPVEAAPFDADHPYNRMAVGAFRNAEVKVFLYSRAPGVTPPICWRPDPATGDLARCN